MSDDDFMRALDDHLDMLYNLARRLARPRHAAEDLVQETCLHALRGWRRHPPQDMRAWLVTICLNLARTVYRRDAVRPIEDLDPDAGADAASTCDTAAEAVAAVVRDDIHQALWRLPYAQREAITLMDLCGFTAAEVAAMTDTPRGTILARVHRGHKQLAAMLSHQRTAPRDA